jgi:hypothetical protein
MRYFAKCKVPAPSLTVMVKVCRVFLGQEYWDDFEKLSLFYVRNAMIQY